MIYDYKYLPLSRNRDEAICAICAGKRVLHLGATDSPFTMEKLEGGLLLHQRLAACCGELYGVDIDAKAIEYLREHGISNIDYFDMNQLGTLPFKPEVIVFGEIIEHLENLKLALGNLRSIMTENTKLVISTPNMFYGMLFLNAFIKQREQIHREHVVGFTYGSLKQLLEVNGFIIDEFHFTFLPRISENINKRILKLICNMRPSIAETLLAVAKVAPEVKVT